MSECTECYYCKINEKKTILCDICKKIGCNECTGKNIDNQNYCNSCIYEYYGNCNNFINEDGICSCGYIDD